MSVGQKQFLKADTSKILYFKQQVKALIKSRGDKSFGALRRSFKHMDVEARGLLTPEDFRAGLMELGLRLSGSELDMLMQCFDLNGDGNIRLVKAQGKNLS